MLTSLVRFIKRFAVLLPGIIIAYISISDIFPSLQERLPVAVAILVTYVLGAYVLIPAVIRLIRFFYNPKHPPTYCVTPDGFASDPINIALVGSRNDLVTAMQAVGWSVADKHNIINVCRGVIAGLTGRTYKKAPMSNLYLLGHRQDIGLEIQGSGVRGQRHHVRFWASNYNPKRPLTRQRVARVKDRPADDEPILWLGAASRDVGFTLIRHNVQLTHMIHPNTDLERDLIVATLQAAKRTKAIDTIRLGEPYRLVNRAWRGYLESDGVLAICQLRSRPAADTANRQR